MRDKYDRVIDYMRISVTDRCNLRCIYCMPFEGIRPIGYKSLLGYEEITRVVTIAAGLGVRKVRITGGEPLVRRNLPFLVESISAVEGIEDISLTTNGQALKRHARALADAGLKRVNVSLDSLYPERYREITRGGDIDEVFKGIFEAERAGLEPIKINMIPLRGINDDEVEDFGRLTVNTSLHVRFIEFMPTGSRDLWSWDRCVSTEEIKGRVSKIGPLLPVKIRKSGPARYFRFEGASGVIGFISPMTHHFCESCNRLRLTSEGTLRPCLFSETEIDLKAPMRRGSTDKEVERLLRLAVQSKPERHSIPSEQHVDYLKPLSKIGG
ncbi:MAG TPA: GTP 3',8-cyclase MoaA [Nitrospiraceae bacterium]|nr:GTP 3',8-cyclase MoaA [Nitrospiraceae bacterium]